MNKFILALLLVTSLSSHAQSNFSYVWDFGTWFGGDKIASNPDGDNYNVGSGATLDFGVSWAFSPEYRLAFRNTLGYRYQGAKTGNGGNRGYIFESSVFKNMDLINIGVGMHADFNNYARDYNGNRTSLQNEVGPFFMIEYMLLKNLAFSAKYHMLDYESEQGEVFSGKQAGVFLSGSF